MSSAFILFTKAPLPGSVKTRLVNPNGISPDTKEVAELYKALLRDTLVATREACDRTGAKLIVSYGPREAELLLKDLIDPIFNEAVYFEQEGKNVSEKVRSSIEFGFSKGFSSVALIPGDHPDLDGQTLSDAIEELSKTSDAAVVLGPTFDGGAYLLGFNRDSFTKVIFDIENTYKVCADIFVKCRRDGIPCHFLENKNDIDDWDDAWRFLRSNAPLQKSATREALEKLIQPHLYRKCEKGLSIVIPTLNEENNIEGILNSLRAQSFRDFEIILVDGGSTDDTIAKALCKVDKIAFVSKPSRKWQENVGGLGAKGAVLLFLHADSLVAPTMCESVMRTAALEGVIGGSCNAMFDGQGARLGFLNAIRRCGNDLLNIHGISSGFFVKRRVFVSTNGFSQDVMEEAVDFQKRTRTLGRYVRLDETIRSSPRRFVSSKNFIPTISIWITTVLLTYLGFHFVGIERRLWNAVR